MGPIPPTERARLWTWLGGGLAACFLASLLPAGILSTLFLIGGVCFVILAGVLLVLERPRRRRR